MNIQQLQINAKRQLALLQNPEIAAILAKHPDVDWKVQLGRNTNQDKITGELYLGYLEANDEDLSPIANCADSDSWGFCETVTLLERPDLRIYFCIRVYQRYTEDETLLLRKIGKLQTQLSPAYPYDSLVCN